MAQPKSAAQSVYPHLQSGERSEVKQRTNSLADALYPSLSKEAKQREADQALWARINEHNRQVLRRGLREANANLRAERRR
jgi:hypothetical protein